MGITNVSPEPGRFSTPIHIFIRFPNIRSATAKTKSFESHRFQRNIAGKNHQVGPGNFISVFLFYRPEQSAGFIKTDIVGPAVKRSKSLLSRASAAASIVHPVRSCTMPGHANE